MGLLASHHVKKIFLFTKIQVIVEASMHIRQQAFVRLQLTVQVEIMDPGNLQLRKAQG